MATPETLPVGYGYVYGRFVTVAGDTTADEDDKPDATPAKGSVVFAAQTPIVQVVDPSPGVIGIQNPITYRLDDQGAIRDDASQSPVALMVGQYKVSFKIEGAALPSFSINLTAEHTKEAPLDIAAVYPLQPSPGLKFVVNEQVYKDTLAAASDAADAASEAQSVISSMIVDAAVQGDDLILSRRDGTTVNAGSVRGAGLVEEIIAGSNVNVDSSDPARPRVSATAAVTSVNGKTGPVVLAASDVGASPAGAYVKPVGGIPAADLTPTVQADLAAASTAYQKPGVGIPATDLTTSAQSSLSKADSALQSAPVDSVNGKTGAVNLTAADVGAAPSGAYVKPANGIPSTDLTTTVRASLAKAESALQAAPVTSVNEKTGAVTLAAADVGAYAKPVPGIPAGDLTAAAQAALAAAGTAVQAVVAGANVTVDASDPQHPVVSASGGNGGAVASVNGKTGAVVLSAGDVGAASAAGLAALTVRADNSLPAYNVRDFGAAGDGATNDTAAVAAAAAAMITAGLGTLYFPAGTYRVTALPTFTPVTIGENRFLPYAVRGDGATVTTIMHYGASQASSLTVHDPDFDVDTPTLGAPVWRGFTIDGTHATGGTCGIVWGDVSDGRFDDIKIESFTQADGFRFQQDSGWTEKVKITRTRVGNCKNLFRFVNNGPYASWMYWDVNADVYPFRNQNVIEDDADSSTHDSSTWRLTMNAEAAPGNTGVIINLPAANSWWQIVWDFTGELYGDGVAHIPIRMTTAAKFFGSGRFNAYFLAGSVIPRPLGWYFGFMGELNLAGVTSDDGEEPASVQGPIRRLVEAQPDDYPTISSGTSIRNTTGSDVLVILPWHTTSNSGAVRLAGPSTGTIGQSGQQVGGGASNTYGSVTYLHPTDQYIRIDTTNAALGTPTIVCI